jgi:hypothetical protein
MAGRTITVEGHIYEVPEWVHSIGYSSNIFWGLSCQLGEIFRLEAGQRRVPICDAPDPCDMQTVEKINEEFTAQVKAKV